MLRSFVYKLMKSILPRKFAVASQMVEIVQLTVNMGFLRSAFYRFDVICFCRLFSLHDIINVLGKSMNVRI